MQEFEKGNKPSTIESAWKSQEESEEQDTQIIMTTDQMCAVAHSQEIKNIWTVRIATVGGIVLAGCFLYNTFVVPEPWIRVGGAWTLGVLCYFIGTLRRRPLRIGKSETCAAFLERQYEGKRQAILAVRRGLFLLIPGIAASCWGRGPLVRARAMGIDPASWFFQFAKGPWPFVTVLLLLAVVWLAFGNAAEKARRDQLDVRRSSQL